MQIVSDSRMNIIQQDETQEKMTIKENNRRKYEEMKIKGSLKGEIKKER
jgi:hypothetical protein